MSDLGIRIMHDIDTIATTLQHQETVTDERLREAEHALWALFDDYLPYWHAHGYHCGVLWHTVFRAQATLRMQVLGYAKYVFSGPECDCSSCTGSPKEP